MARVHYHIRGCFSYGRYGAVNTGHRARSIGPRCVSLESTVPRKDYEYEYEDMA